MVKLNTNKHTQSSCKSLPDFTTKTCGRCGDPKYNPNSPKI